MAQRPEIPLVADSVITPSMLRAYLETDYHVHADVPFAFRIGHASSALAALHREHGVASSAFITASNPYSRLLDHEENAARRADFALELGRRGLPFIAGVGRHPSGSWPGEESFLVLGLARDEAAAWGRRLEQNAIVWTAADAVPQLVALR